MEEKILQGGVTLAIQIAPNLQLHYLGDVIELTNNQQKIKAIYHRIGRWIE